MLERESSARARGVPALARIQGCESVFDGVPERALSLVVDGLTGSRNSDLVWSWSSGDPIHDRVEQDFWTERTRASLLSSAPTVGVLLNAGALAHLCLACHLLSRSRPSETGTPHTASAFALERYWAHGAAGAVLAAIDSALPIPEQAAP
jgi:hypothetical protein